MITAQDAYVRTNSKRGVRMSEVKGEIEARILVCIEFGSFDAEVYYSGQSLDKAQQEEIVDYLKGLGYVIDHSDHESIGFSWRAQNTQ